MNYLCFYLSAVTVSFLFNASYVDLIVFISLFINLFISDNSVAPLVIFVSRSLTFSLFVLVKSDIDVLISDYIFLVTLLSLLLRKILLIPSVSSVGSAKEVILFLPISIGLVVVIGIDL